MVCFYEIIYKKGTASNPQWETGKLIQGDEFEDEMEYGTNPFGARHKGQQFPDMVAAKHFVVPTETILEVSRFCDDDLLEHINDYYREIDA
jgi:hypothetical protein